MDRRTIMRRVTKVLGLVAAGLLAAVGGAGAWLYLFPSDGILSSTSIAAKIVCSNVFMARRDPADVIGTDVAFMLPRAARHLTIRVSTSESRVDATYLGLFARRSALHVPDRGCTLAVDGRTAHSAPLPPSTPSAALWPAGDRVEPPTNARLMAALNDTALQGPGMRAIVVVHEGRIVAETYGSGFDAGTPLLGWSMTKTVNTVLAGMAIADGRLSLDRRNLFAQWSGDERADISVADLMAMTTGLAWNEDQGPEPDPGLMEFVAKDAAAFARDRRLVARAGSRFSYSSGASLLLSRVWQDAVGLEASDYPPAKLFRPLGMASAVLEADPTGTFLGDAFLYATARDWARFAEFLRRGGEWNGRQLLPADFIDYMRSPVLLSDAGRGPVYGRGSVWLARGLGFRLPADTYLMQGHLRQVIAIIPSRKLVILRMGLTREDVGYSTARLLMAIVAAIPEPP